MTIILFTILRPKGRTAEQHLSVLMVIFPGEPELASFIGAKDNGSGEL